MTVIRISRDEFSRLAEYIYNNFGIVMKEDKQSFMTARLHQLLAERKLASFGDYYEELVNDRSGRAADALLERITTNYTFFMREQPHYEFMRAEALPYFRDTIKDGDLRVWSAGCSSGEEPYTLAMLLDEFFMNDKRRWDKKILATDISKKVLDTAAKAVYTKDSLAVLPAHWRMQYITWHDKQHAIIEESIRNQVIFRQFNLMERQFPFKRKFHVIFCRNVMIYFDQQTKMALIQRFYDALEHGGYLFIGHSESISRSESPFRYVMPAVYRKE